MTLQASLVAQSEASLKQAKSANTAAKSFMAKKDEAEDESETLKKLNKTLEAVKAECDAIKADRDAIKSQAESVSNEYDRLLGEYEKLQKTVGSESKKDD